MQQSYRRFSPWGIAVLILGFLALWWFYPHEDKTVWRFAPVVSLPGGDSHARSVSTWPDGKTLAIAVATFAAIQPGAPPGRPHRTEVQLWDIASRQYRKTLTIPHGSFGSIMRQQMAFSSNSRSLRFDDVDVTVWDTDSGALLSEASLGANPGTEQEDFGQPMSPWDSDRKMECRARAFSRDGLWCAAAILNSMRGWSGEFVQLWHRAGKGKPWEVTGKLPAMQFSNNIIDDLAFSSDGALLAMPIHDGTVKLYTTSPLRLLKTWPMPHWTFQAAFSPDDRYRIGCGGSDTHTAYRRRGGILDFWNVASGKLEHTVRAPKLLRNFAVSADGATIAAVEGDETVFVCRSPLVAPSEPRP